MPGGRLRERIAFAVRGDLNDGRGNKEGPFIDQFTVAAQIVSPRPGSQQSIADRLGGVQSVTFRIRCSIQAARIAAGWRATDARTGTVYGVVGVSNPDEKRIYYDVAATSGEGA